jgi:flagellar biosynthesis protein FlhF
MKVKKFVSKSMPEAMKLIRTELGSDAVILHSKVVQNNGFLGLFRKKNIEVIAAVDSMVTTSQPKVPQKTVETPKTPVVNSKPSLAEDNTPGIVQEIKELKALMTSFARDSGSEHYPIPLQEVYRLLTEQEFDSVLRNELMTVLLEKWYVHHGEGTKIDVLEWLNEILLERISGFQYGGISYEKKYINVVGPTGVGKTTTLAKIAAECIIKDHKKVAFITTDTYRIAAIDQLKTYAKILDIPIEVSYNIEDFKRAKEKFSDYDVVLIDTAGRNFRNPKYVKDLNNIIDFNKDCEILLVLALTSKFSDMREIYKQFSLLEINKIIFTKVDETTIFGPMINFMLAHHTGVAYLTTGQNVPDDMVVASPEIILQTIFGEH